MKSLKVLLVVSSILLTACGGGSSDSPEVVTPVSVPPSGGTTGSGGTDNTDREIITDGAVLDGGIWFGTSPAEAEGALSSYGDLHVRTTTLSNGEYYHMSGQLNIDGSTINKSDIKVYTSLPDVPAIAGSTGTGSFSGSIETDSSGNNRIKGVLEYDNSTFDVTLNYNSLTSSGSNLSTINETWSYDVIESGNSVYTTISISIDEDGILSGSDTDGCVFEGTAIAPNEEINSYSLDVTVYTCAAAGEYVGTGFTTSGNVNFNLFLSGESSFWFSFRK